MVQLSLQVLPICVVWFRFRLLRRYLALWPVEVGRVYRLLEMVSEGSPGHGPIHLLSASAAEIGFQWDPVELGWVRPSLPLLCNLAGPVQHFKAALLDAWRNKVAADLCSREGFRGGLCWMSMAPCSSLALLSASKCYGWWRLEWFSSWQGYLMVTVISSGNVPFLLLLRFVKISIS